MPINHSIWWGIFLRGAFVSRMPFVRSETPPRQSSTSTVPVLQENSVDELSFGGRPSLRRAAPFFSEHSCPRLSVWRRS